MGIQTIKRASQVRIKAREPHLMHCLGGVPVPPAELYCFQLKTLTAHSANESIRSAVFRPGIHRLEGSESRRRDTIADASEM